MAELLFKTAHGEQAHKLDGTPVTIGRHPDNKIIFESGTVSGRHAELTPSGAGRYRVRDLNSSNGTRIDGERITEAELHDGAIICFGDVECLFQSADITSDSETRVVSAGCRSITSPDQSQATFFSRLARLARAAFVEAKRYARLAALHAKIATLKHIDFAKAHYALGKRAYKLKIHAERFDFLYREIADLEQKIAKDRKGISAAADATTMEKAKSMAVSAKMLAEAEALDWKLKRLFMRLGSNIANAGAPGDQDELMTEIRTLESTIEQMERRHVDLSEDHSSRTEMTELSIALRTQTAAQLQKAGDTFIEIVTGTPTGPGETSRAQLVPQQITLRHRLMIGRDSKCDIVLPARDVSQAHAEIVRDASGFVVRDLCLTGGTFLNGQMIDHTPTSLREGDRLRIGPFTFLRDGDLLLSSSEKHNTRMSVRGLCKSVVSRETRQPLNLLDDISLVIEPKEFVALLGPSGSGKSTFMDAINGRRPATSGRVMVNDDDFYQSYQYYRRAIGYVPQQDIVHTTLTVTEAMRFAARLRLPADTSKAEVERIVGGVIAKLGLEEKRHTSISQLSGGQLKRVSLGVELISDPSLLFLDEATSGLDAGTEGKMMALFRRVADEGATVVCITHNIENVGLCDLVVVLMKGKLAYYGPPRELTAYFGVGRVSEVYDRLETASAEEWGALFQTSEQYRRYIGDRLKLAATESNCNAATGLQESADTADKRREGLRQLQVLRQRYTVATFRDHKNLLILLAQAPIIAALIGLVFRSSEIKHTAVYVLFLMVISAVWFGCANSAKEIVKELPVYLRERAINLMLLPYLGSKMIVLSALCAIQCLALVLIVVPMTGLDTGICAPFILLFLTSLSAMMMGLVVSALVDNTDKATAIVPILLIPQVILAGAITPLHGLPLGIARTCIVSFWAFDAAQHATSFDTRELQQSWAADVLVIFIFSAVFAAVAAYCLRRKDIFSHATSGRR